MISTHIQELEEIIKELEKMEVPLRDNLELETRLKMFEIVNRLKSLCQ